MNRPTFEILKKIINSGGKSLLVTELMDKYDIGTRTFYNYINEINHYLKSNNIDGSLIMENDTLKANIDETCFSYISSLMNSMDFNEYKLSNEERCNIIILVLLSNNSTVKKKYFEEDLLVSRTSIINDMRYVKSFFAEQGIPFKDNNHLGLEIECDEKTRRKIMTNLLINKFYVNIEEGFLPLNPYLSFANSYLKLDKSRIVSEEAIKKSEKETNIELTDHNYFCLTVILSYIVSRLKTRNQLLRKKTSVKNDNSLLFAKHLFSNLENIIDYNYEEVEFFSELIKEYGYIDCSSQENSTDNSYLQLIVKEFLETLSFCLKINLIEDNDLLSFLIAHIDNCQRRISNGEKFDNPYRSQIISEYEDYYNILKKNIYILENGLSVPFDDDETVLILMHILASIERKKDLEYTPRVVVACGSGAATCNFLASLIRKNFKVNIISVSSLHNALSVIENDNVDLIISTVPFTNKNIPVVVVDPYLKNDDILNIQNTLKSITNQTIHFNSKDSSEIKNITENYSDKITDLNILIKESLIKLDVDARNWKEAIIAAGELLLWEKCINVNYLQQMVQLVDKYGPYIVINNGVAFAHASPSQGSLKNGISIIRLNKPVVFGKKEFDPVKVVAGFSILDSSENIKILMKIMNIIKDPVFLETVINAKDKTDVIKLLNEVDDYGKD